MRYLNTVNIPLSRYIFSVLTFLTLSIAACTPSPAPNDSSLTNQSQNKDADAKPVRLAVASNLASVLPSVVAAYKRDNEVAVEFDITYASSGKLYAQINAGAPYDMFLSANQSYPNQLYTSNSQNQTPAQLPYAPFTYARGQLCLYSNTHPILSGETVVSNENTNIGFDEQSSLNADMLDRLLNTYSDSKLAIANPDLAPYGASAKAYLTSHGLYNKLASLNKLIQAENIGQAFQYTHTQSVDFGMVSVAQVKATDTPPENYLVLNKDSYPAILQDAIVLTEHPQAIDFAYYLQSDSAQALFSQAGYLPSNSAKQ